MLWSVSGAFSAAPNPAVVWIGHQDFGDLAPGLEARHEFVLKNSSPLPLELKRVSTSCDCIQVVSAPQVIPPLAEGRVALVARPSQPGAVDYAIHLESGADGAKRVFTMSGVVRETAAPRTPDPALVTATELIRTDAGPSNVVYIDVRTQDKFHLARIPGALNLPLFTLKTKGFLRAKRLVLLNEGHNPTELCKECQRLRELGFASVRVLDGGIRAWQQQGGVLDGERADAAVLARLAADQFDLARSGGGWLVVYAGHTGAVESGADIWASLRIAPVPGNFAADLTAALRDNPNARRVLLIGGAGNSDAALENLVRSACALPVFYLAGGLEEYNQFLARQLAMQNRRQLTMASPNGTRFNHSPEPAVKTGGCCGGTR